MAEEEVVGFGVGVVEGQSLPKFSGVVFDREVDKFMENNVAK